MSALPEYCWLYLSELNHWVTNYKIEPAGIQIGMTADVRSAKIFASIDPGDVEEIGSRGFKVQVIGATFEEWVLQEAGPEVAG